MEVAGAFQQNQPTPNQPHLTPAEEKTCVQSGRNLSAMESPRLHIQPLVIVRLTKEKKGLT